MKTYEFHSRDGTTHEITRPDHVTVPMLASAISSDEFLCDVLQGIRCSEIIRFRLIPLWELKEREARHEILKQTLADMRVEHTAQESKKTWWRWS